MNPEIQELAKELKQAQLELEFLLSKETTNFKSSKSKESFNKLEQLLRKVSEMEDFNVSLNREEKLQLRAILEEGTRIYKKYVELTRYVPNATLVSKIKEVLRIMFGWIKVKDIAFVVLLTVLFVCFQTFAQLSAYRESFRYIFCAVAVMVLGFQFLVSKNEHRETRFLVLGWLVVCFGMGMNEKFLDSLNRNEISQVQNNEFPVFPVIILLIIAASSLFRNKLI